MSTHGGNFFMHHHSTANNDWSPFASNFANGHHSNGSRTPVLLDQAMLGRSPLPPQSVSPPVTTAAAAAAAVQQHQQQQKQQQESALFSQIFKPVLADVVSGIGKLTWLSSKAGLLTCSGANGNKTVSFQLKDFCDAGVSDLTSVLRPGFTLAFQAIASEAGDLIGTHVSPVIGAEAEIEFTNAKEVNLESPELAMSGGPPRLAKDTYLVDLEIKAVPMLLSIFRVNPTPQAQLSSLHSQISNCGDEDLFRYIGTSSLKRRQFLERRTHIFKIGQGDCVVLQPAALFNTVNALARFLLRRGGATTTDSLFDYFTNCPDLDRDAYRIIGEGRNAFMNLITEHSWIFALFPGGQFVSVKRNLPHFDYTKFMTKYFGDTDSSNIRSIFNKPTPLSSLSSNNGAPLMSSPLLGGPNGNRLPLTHNGSGASNGSIGNVTNCGSGSAVTRPIGPVRSNGMLNNKGVGPAAPLPLSAGGNNTWMGNQPMFDFGAPVAANMSTGSSPMSPWPPTFHSNMAMMQPFNGNHQHQHHTGGVTSACAQTSSVWTGTSAAMNGKNGRSRACDAATQTDYSTLTNEIACGPDESVHRCACGNVMPIGSWSPLSSAPSSVSQLSPFAGGHSKSSFYSSSGRSSSGDVSEQNTEKLFTPFSQVLPFDLNFAAMKLS